MKKTLIFIVILAMLTALAAGCSGAPKNALEKILEKGEITVSLSPDFVPYEFLDLDTNEAVGSDVEFAKYIASELGVELKIEQMEFETSIAAASTGKVDLCVSALSWKPDRAESMELSEYYNVGTYKYDAILIKKDMLETFNALGDFAGKKVVAQNGSVQFELASTQLKDAEVTPISVVNDGVLMLLSDKVDGIALPYDTMLGFVNQYPDQLAMSTCHFDNEEFGNVVACKKGETELIQKINEIIKKAAGEGLFDKWFTEASQLAQDMGAE